MEEALPSQHTSESLSKLHRDIRLSNWSSVSLNINRHSNGTQLVDQIVYNSNQSIIPLLLQDNTIGWTAVHFTSLHGAPDLAWWTWILSKVLEEHHLFRRRMEDNDNAGFYKRYLENPFFRRTEAGHSATDLFFSKRLYPFPWERVDVRREAKRLLEGIEAILSLEEEKESHQDIITELRRRIFEKMNEERIRQETYGMNPNRLLQAMDNFRRRPEAENEPLAAHLDIAGSEELDHEMAQHDHIHETQENHVDQTQNVSAINGETSIVKEEHLDIVVNFFHEMQLLIMAATRLSLCMGGEYDWSIVHGLSVTGCPLEIGRLAVKLYPEQLRHRDNTGSLPLHLASSSHKTSALADGTWHHNRQPYGDNASSSPPMMKCLLEEYPAAALELNSEGRYPINIAITAGKTWLSGVSDIFDAGPNVILDGTLDRLTRLPSFMLAAMQRNSARCRQNRRIGSSVGFEEEMRAKRTASKTIGSMWRLLPQQAKVRALKEAKNDIEAIQLTTVFELLRAMPEIICIRQSSES